MFLRRFLISFGLATLLITACTSQTPATPLTPTRGLPSTPAIDEPTASLAHPGTPSVSPSQLAVNDLASSPTVIAAGTPAAATSGVDRIALDYVKELVQGLGPRQSATSQEFQAAQFLAKEFESMGYSTEIQPFDVDLISSQTSSLTTGDAPLEPIQVIPLNGTIPGLGAGPLVDLGLARPEDVPEDSLAGKVALVQRGIITFQEKVSRVAQAGAVAAIIYNNLPGNFQGTLGQASSIPAVSISSQDGAKLLELLTQSQVEATLSVERVQLPSRNVIAEKPGGEGKVVVLGGHYDTVAEIAGANDNSSGTAVLLTVAGQLAGRELPFKVMFVAFGSEELGLLGSRAYLDSLTDDEKGQIVAMFNFDALASGGQVTILGSDRLTRLAAKAAEDLDVPVFHRRSFTGASSDHANFIQVGIPVLMFTAPDFSRIHTSDDILEFVEPALLGDSARLALRILESEDFPQ